MKKYILILFSIISFWSCTEDESIDITVLPSVTTTGANTFGCLMDGWIYVGGRYLNWGHSYVWTYDSFHYYPEEDKLAVNVSVKPDINIHFIILSPQEGKEATLTDIRFRGEELEDGTAFISHFDPELNIISATFGNGKRLTNGRFDIHYTYNTTAIMAATVITIQIYFLPPPYWKDCYFSDTLWEWLSHFHPVQPYSAVT